MMLSGCAVLLSEESQADTVASLITISIVHWALQHSSHFFATVHTALLIAEDGWSAQSIDAICHPTGHNNR